MHDRNVKWGLSVGENLKVRSFHPSSFMDISMVLNKKKSQVILQVY